MYSNASNPEVFALEKINTNVIFIVDLTQWFPTGDFRTTGGPWESSQMVRK